MDAISTRLETVIEQNKEIIKLLKDIEKNQKQVNLNEYFSS